MIRLPSLRLIEGMRHPVNMGSFRYENSYRNLVYTQQFAEPFGVLSFGKMPFFWFEGLRQNIDVFLCSDFASLFKWLPTAPRYFLYICGEDVQKHSHVRVNLEWKVDALALEESLERSLQRYQAKSMVLRTQSGSFAYVDWQNELRRFWRQELEKFTRGKGNIRQGQVPRAFSWALFERNTSLDCDIRVTVDQPRNREVCVASSSVPECITYLKHYTSMWLGHDPMGDFLYCLSNKKQWFYTSELGNWSIEHAIEN